MTRQPATRRASATRDAATTSTLLVPMINAAYADTEGHVFLGTPRTERARHAARLVGGIIVAEVDGRHRRAACTSTSSSDPAHFGLLAVDTSLHARGIGSLLVEHAETLARDAGARRCASRR